MLTFNRRQFGKLVSSMLCTTAFPVHGLETPPDQMSTIQQLNLVFHGLFAFIVDRNSGITVLAPYDSKHKYRCLCRSIYDNMQKGEYSFKGIVSAGSPPILESNNVVLPANKCNFVLADVDKPQKRYLKFILPFPTSMIGLRHTSSSRVTFSGSGANCLIVGEKIPLAQVLSYAVEKPDDLGMYLNCSMGEQRKWPVSGYSTHMSYEADIINLHIFAEPASKVKKSHAEHAFRNLAKLIHPNLASLKGTLEPPYERVGIEYEIKIPGMLSEEQAFLQERVNPITSPGCMPVAAQGGVQVVNCMSIVITN